LLHEDAEGDEELRHLQDVDEGDEPDREEGNGADVRRSISWALLGAARPQGFLLALKDSLLGAEDIVA
jgi:hypothetical protein